MFAILWAWMNYTWFASAFDNDDAGMRIATLVQMVGVLVLGLGQAPFFASLEHGHPDNRVMIGGYVIMRVSMVYLWLRVAREDPGYAAKGLAYAKWIVVALFIWVVQGVLRLRVAAGRTFALIAMALEFLGRGHHAPRADAGATRPRCRGPRRVCQPRRHQGARRQLA